MMKLSIIIPLYNSEKYISACLDSLLDQNLSQKEFEIIIINDGSKDRSLKIVKKYALNYSNIKIHSQNNQGASVARNKGIQIAKGEFLYFVDSDDYIVSNVLKKLVGYLNDEIDLLAFKIIQTKNTNLKFSNIESLNNSSYKIISGTAFILKYSYKDAVGWFFVRKQFLINNNLFYLEGKKLEDISFNLELFAVVKKLLFLPVDVYRYVQRPNSVMTKKGSNHNKEIILDYERVVSEFENKIMGYRAKNPEVSKKLIWKQVIYHFFLFVRILRSDLSIKEIDKKIKQYSKINLYPLKYYSESLKVNVIIFIFNHKYLFYVFIKAYRFLNN